MTTGPGQATTGSGQGVRLFTVGAAALTEAMSSVGVDAIAPR